MNPDRTATHGSQISQVKGTLDDAGTALELLTSYAYSQIVFSE